MSLKLSESSID
ncbi:unnamed protein product [Lactuca saligna]|uniref:Uncharacterized protein n=1 Tax=Lactuca saligna TaxID=75948 RepID=A0AA35YM52_LACSI|nr:unnamed protein product [Lactuca saligna]